MAKTEKIIVTQGATVPVTIMPTTNKAPVSQAVSKAVATAPAPVAAAKVAVKSEVKATAKAAQKPAAKPAAKTVVKAKPKAASKAKDIKTSKLKKPKLVRDSFTIPKTESIVLDDLKQRSGKLANSVKKSELIRAGVKALAAMSDMAFLSALKAVPTIKTGRPSKANVS